MKPLVSLFNLLLDGEDMGWEEAMQTEYVPFLFFLGCAFVQQWCSDHVVSLGAGHEQDALVVVFDHVEMNGHGVHFLKCGGLDIV